MPARDQHKTDTDHLRLLAICHNVAAGFAVLGILFIISHFLLMNALMEGGVIGNEERRLSPPAGFIAIANAMYAFMAIYVFATAVLNFLSARYLAQRKHRTFSIVVAGFNCLHMPLGTLLGVFTILVLARESVRELYEARESSEVISDNPTA